MKTQEEYSFQLITFSGSAKSKCFLAIKEAKLGNFDVAEKLIEEAETSFLEAHKSHSSLIQKEARGENVIMTLLLSHAEDQLMNAELTKEMALEIIDIHKEISILKRK